MIELNNVIHFGFTKTFDWGIKFLTFIYSFAKYFKKYKWMLNYTMMVMNFKIVHSIWICLNSRWVCIQYEIIKSQFEFGILSMWKCL